MDESNNYSIELKNFSAWMSLMQMYLTEDLQKSKKIRKRQVAETAGTFYAEHAYT